MMDEIKQIIEMIAKLPQLAIWVLVAFWAYKVIVIGSVYGVIRFVVEKVHSWATTPKEKLEIVEVRGKLDKLTIGSPEFLIAQIGRIVGKRVGISTSFLHDQSIQWLKEAIDEKEARDREAKVRA
jgi:hypothetical protein